MRWANATGINKDHVRWLIPDAIDSDKGYRIIRQRIFATGYRYSAWRPAPDLSYPSLALLDFFDCSDDAKAACTKHYAETINEQK